MMTIGDKLRYSFLFGAMVDLAIAFNWLLIAMGYEFPSVISGYRGSGEDYRFAMYVSAMFMTGWSVVLIWGAIKPWERKGLLVITACFLLLSVIIELTVFTDVLSGGTMFFGVAKRLLLIVLFCYVYFTSLQTG